MPAVWRVLCKNLKRVESVLLLTSPRSAALFPMRQSTSRGPAGVTYQDTRAPASQQYGYGQQQHPTTNEDIAGRISSLEREVKKLVSRPVTNSAYVSALVQEGTPFAGERVELLAGTLSVIELTPRQARVPSQANPPFGNPIVKKVPIKKGLSGRLFGPRVRRVTGYMSADQGDPTAAQLGLHARPIQTRYMVLYQPVVAPARRKAVLVGINYLHAAKRTTLRNPCSDARYMRQWLHKHDFHDCLMLTDDDPAAVYPSRENIMKACKWLIHGTRMGDNLFFFYSGHGDWKLDSSGDEPDDHDECIVPADADDLAHPMDAKMGLITDDELYQLLVAPSKEGVMMHALFDSCHSGTVLDLPYMHRRDGSINFVTNLTGIHKDANKLPGDIIMISAAQDAQTTADSSRFTDIPMGLLTYSFLRVMEGLDHPSQITYDKLYLKIFENLARYSPPLQLEQRALPLMSSSKPYNLDHPFVI